MSTSLGARLGKRSFGQRCLGNVSVARAAGHLRAACVIPDRDKIRIAVLEITVAIGIGAFELTGIVRWRGNDTGCARIRERVGEHHLSAGSAVEVAGARYSRRNDVALGTENVGRKRAAEQMDLMSTDASIRFCRLAVQVSGRRGIRAAMTRHTVLRSGRLRMTRCARLAHGSTLVILPMANLAWLHLPILRPNRFAVEIIGRLREPSGGMNFDACRRGRRNNQS